jgi:hypothetical protein
MLAIATPTCFLLAACATPADSTEPAIGGTQSALSSDHVGPVIGGNNRQTNLSGVAGAGAYVSELRGHWDGDKIRGLSWAYSDGSCIHAAGCSWGDTGYDQYSSDLRYFTPNETIKQCFLRDSGYGYRSLRQIECTTTRQHFVFGPDGYDNQADEGGVGDVIVGFHGAVNQDNFMQNLAIVTRSPFGSSPGVKGPSYSWDEATNPGGPNRCNNDYQCSGTRTCSDWGWCHD